MATPNRTKPASKAKQEQERPVIACTEHRGVFFGYATNTDAALRGEPLKLRDARMVINWRSGRGVMDAAERGPVLAQCKISSRANITINKVTSIFEVTPQAQAAWDGAQL